MSHIKRLCRYLTPLCILPQAVVAAFALLAAFMADLGAEAMAGFSVAQRVVSLFSGMLIWWMLVGLVLSSIQAEQGRRRRAKTLYGITLTLFILLSIGMAAALRFSAGPLVQLYSTSDAITASALSLLGSWGVMSGMVTLAALLIGQLFRRYHPVVVILLNTLLIVLAAVAPAVLQVFDEFNPTTLGMLFGVLFALGYTVPFALIPWRSFVKSFEEETPA